MKNSKDILMKFISTQGYKRNSPDVNRPLNVIPSGRITMQDVDFPVRGVDNLGNEMFMVPGGEYFFPGDYVVETPMMQRGGQTNNDREMVEGIADILTMVKDPVNRRQIAAEMVRDFKREGVKYDLQEFQKMAQVRMQRGGLTFQQYYTPAAESTGANYTPTMTVQAAEKLKAQRDAQELARRKQAIQASQAAASKPLRERLTPENLAQETGATGDKLRFFPNDPDSFIDDYLNPFKMVGDMASGLGRIPLNVKQGNYGAAALDVAIPVATGALAGLGAKSAGQFVNNLTNPLAGTGQFLTTKTPLKNAYRLNSVAAKQPTEVILSRVQKPGQTADLSRLDELLQRPPESLTLAERIELARINQPGYGRGFSSNPNDISYYSSPGIQSSRGYVGMPEIRSIRLPAEKAAKFNIRQNPVEGYFSGAPGREYLLPRNYVELSKKLTPQTFEELEQIRRLIDAETTALNTPHWWRGYPKSTPNAYDDFVESGVVRSNAPNSLAGTGNLAANAAAKSSTFGQLKSGLQDLGYIYDQSLGYLFNNRANKKAIAEGNEWLKNWIQHPTTQAKIDNDFAGKINNSFVKNMYDVGYEQAKNFTPVSTELPLSVQLAKGFYPNKDNWGVSYLHHVDPMRRRMIEQGQMDAPIWHGSFISRTLDLPYKKRVGTTIHEGTHDWTSKFGLEASGQREFLERNINPEIHQDLEYWRRHGDDKTRTDLGKKRKYQAYLADPTEQHARIMELRKYLGHTPDFVSTPEYAQKVMNHLSAMPRHKRPIDSEGFFKVIDNDPQKLSNMFNRLWGVTPVAVAGAAAASEKQYGGQLAMEDLRQRALAQSAPRVDNTRIVSQKRIVKQEAENPLDIFPFVKNVGIDTGIDQIPYASVMMGAKALNQGRPLTALSEFAKVPLGWIGDAGINVLQENPTKYSINALEDSVIPFVRLVKGANFGTGESIATQVGKQIMSSGEKPDSKWYARSFNLPGLYEAAKTYGVDNNTFTKFVEDNWENAGGDYKQILELARTNLRNKQKGGQHGGLDRWFAEKWVDIKTGKECGRQEGEKRAGYPACRPSKRISEDTPKTASELSSSEKEKFKRSKTSSERISYQHKRKQDGGEWLDKYDEGGAIYTVKKGDTLSKIAAENKTTVNKIVQANNIKNPNIIGIDQKLVIPQGSSVNNAQTGSTQYVDWSEKKKNLDRLNNLPDEQLITGFYSDKPEQTYLVVDKKNAQMKVYKGDKVVKIYEVGVGANPGDAQTVTKIVNGKTDWSAGNKSTGAGAYTISNIDPASKAYYGLPSFNLKNDRGIEVATTIHGTPAGRRSRFDNNNVEDNRMSYGCINGKCFDLKDLQQYVDIETPVYVLPEDEGNRFQIVDGKPVLKVSAQNRAKYNSYVDATGKVQKGQGANQSVNTLSYSPIKAVFDENKFKEKVFSWNDLNDEKEYVQTTKPFYNALVKYKQSIMKNAKIPSDVYNELARMAFGIYGTESNFGDTHSAVGNFARDSVKFIDPKNSSSPDYKSKATTYGANEDSRSVGLTQIRWNYLNKDEKQVLNSLGITSNMDFMDPEKAAIGTVALLGVRYNQQLTDDQKRDIWSHLPSKWNRRGNYSDRVKQNASYLNFKEATNKRQTGGQTNWLDNYTD